MAFSFVRRIQAPSDSKWPGISTHPAFGTAAPRKTIHYRAVLARRGSWSCCENEPKRRAPDNELSALDGECLSRFGLKSEMTEKKAYHQRPPCLPRTVKGNSDHYTSTVRPSIRPAVDPAVWKLTNALHLTQRAGGTNSMSIRQRADSQNLLMAILLLGSWVPEGVRLSGSSQSTEAISSGAMQQDSHSRSTKVRMAGYCLRKPVRRAASLPV
jgi:hypothetical protein